MPKTLHHIQAVGELVEQVLQERMTAETAISQWPDIDHESNVLIKELWHRLVHFVNDADIRGRDPSYDTSERKHIRSLLTELRAEHPSEAEK